MKIKKKTVQQALSSYSWVQDIQGNVSLAGNEQYLEPWDVLEKFQLQDIDDKHIWRFSSNGLFSTKSAYRAFFTGAVSFEPWKRVWKRWATKCKTFIWLAIKNKCWTADRLQKRGLDFPENCILCDQEDETVQHILTNGVFARQFWHDFLSQIGLTAVVPKRRDVCFVDRWRKASSKIPKGKRKGFNSVVILGAWSLWNHRNRCVFDGARPCLESLKEGFREELQLWFLAGVKNLRKKIDPG
jgi:hypothetical protein